MKSENSLLTAGNVITTVLLTVASDRLYIDESPLFYVVGACTTFLLISVLTRIVKQEIVYGQGTKGMSRM